MLSHSDDLWWTGEPDALFSRITRRKKIVEAMRDLDQNLFDE